MIFRSFFIFTILTSLQICVIAQNFNPIDSIINADVYLKVDKPESYDNKIVEINLHSSLGEYFAKKQADSFEESADLAIEALRRQLKKYKEIL